MTQRREQADDFEGDCRRNGDYDGFHDYRGDTFAFEWSATAPGCGRIDFTDMADERHESEATARERAADELGVRAEFVVLHLRRQVPNF